MDTDVSVEIKTRKCQSCGHTQGIPFSECPACGVDIASVEVPEKTTNLRIGRSDRRESGYNRRGKTGDRRIKINQPRPYLKPALDVDIEYETAVTKIMRVAIFAVAAFIAIAIIQSYT